MAGAAKAALLKVRLAMAAQPDTEMILRIDLINTRLDE
jgi:hypothetical protein